MVPKMLPRIFSRQFNKLSIIKALKEFNCLGDYGEDCGAQVEDISVIQHIYGGAQGSAARQAQSNNQRAQQRIGRRWQRGKSYIVRTYSFNTPVVSVINLHGGSNTTHHSNQHSNIWKVIQHCYRSHIICTSGGSQTNEPSPYCGLSLSPWWQTGPRRRCWYEHTRVAITWGRLARRYSWGPGIRGKFPFISWAIEDTSLEDVQ